MSIFSVSLLTFAVLVSFFKGVCLLRGNIGMSVHNENSFLLFYRMKCEVLQVTLHGVVALITKQNILTFSALYGIILPIQARMIKDGYWF